MDKLRDKKWFRLSVGSSSGGGAGSSIDSPDESAPTASSNNNPTTLTTPNASHEPSRFEKFRRASFRRKSTGQTTGRKRSKSPHSILQPEKSTSLEEADEDAEKERSKGLRERMEAIGELLVNRKSSDNAPSANMLAQQPLYKSEVDIVLKASAEDAIDSLQPLSEIRPNGKKATLKSIKTDPPKRKFYKNFTTSSTRRQSSLENTEPPPQLTPPVPLALDTKLSTNAFAKSKNAFEEDDDDTDSDTDDDDDDDDDDESSEPEPDVDDNLPKRSGKEKILLTDRKFKHNRIEKSASKTKMSELEKRESLKRSRSARKIAAQALALKDEQVTSLSNNTAANKKKDKVAEKDVRDRKHSNLNLQAFVNFVMSNKKFLNTDEFTLHPRKSISDAASNMLVVAATCKPLPIALKYAPEGVVAEAPKENDSKTERNVVLVKKQNLKNSFCDRLNNNNNNSSSNNNNQNTNIDSNVHKYSECEKPEPNKGPDKPKRKKQKTKKNIEVVEGNKEIFKCLDSTVDANHALSATVKRNSSNSSKSSGNFEDEAFYSYDEQDNEKLKNAGVGDAASLGASTASSSGLGSAASSPTLPSEEVAGTQSKRKSSSPSLTSRVAAKINEKTNNYRNRRAVAAVAAAAANKMGKKRKTQRPEFYKQISVERLHASPIVRQPSDRRPDAGGNQASRSNGNATDNNDDVLRQQQPAFNAAAGADANASKGAVARGARDSLAAGGTAMDVTELGANGGAAAAADINAQDAAEGKDARRERLHQQHQQNKSAPVSVNRSESYKERLSHKRNRNSRRKTSDPSLTSRPNDEQADVGLANSNYTASSNSSLSSGGGSESPSTSMEQVGGAGSAGNAAHHHSSSLHGQHTAHHMHHHNHHDSFHGSIGGGSMNASFWSGPITGHLARQSNFESDEDDDLNETDWSSNVAADVLAALTDAEKKRQEIINEIYQTERSHVRTLKLLESIFLAPLQESGVLSHEDLTLLFPPALLALRDLHSSFEQKLKQRRLEHNHIVKHIGDLLASMFHGQSGEQLCDYAAKFCARQQIALEALKDKRRKDEQLQKILSKAESHKACRRLQLKDLLPAVLQRLTKYPLLFENLFKVTIRVVPENTDEAEAIKRALESSKKILVDVNQAVKTAEDAHKLQNIQRKLDKSTFDKDEFKNLDLTQYRLIHDGSLTMKKNPSIQLHGLLFEDMIVLLTKQDDKYSLKYLHAARNTEVNNKPVSPIMSIDSETLVRQEAADKNSFFLIKTKTSQMLELRAPSSSECKTWFKHISDAAEQYKPRSKNANHEPVDDPAIATIPHSNTKESLELTPERPPPMAVTATVTTTPLAPMMPIATATSVQQHGNNVNNINNNYENNVQLRNGRRESTPTAAAADNGAYYKQRLSHNELTPSMSTASSASSVNRTMSTRSCGEANSNNSSGYSGDGASGVTLRHTQSARQANGPNAADGYNAGSNLLSEGSKRDSASIVYSNNSNNTRTLMQSSPPLVEPTAIQISISPAHTAEPVLTPSERLRRVDAAIRDGLLEKQKIICDMFRLPVEHFNEIVDIAAMPEAPKDSADIALAAYAQVQSLTEVLNEYLQVTPEQEISAVSTAVCDQCHEKQQHRNQRQIMPPATTTASPTSSSSSSTATQIAATAAASDTPPPLPPPNKQSGAQQAQQQTPTNVRTVLQNAVMDEVSDIHEDDDGYCEIDELRLPALPATLSTAKTKATSPPPPLPPPAGGFKVPPPPPPHPTATAAAAATPTQTAAPVEASTNTTGVATAIPELVKRQSTISADSIPEESADEVTKALSEDVPEEPASAETELNETLKTEESVETKEQKQEKEETLKESETIGNSSDDAASKEEQENEENVVNEGKEEESSGVVATSETTVETEEQSANTENTEKETVAVEADKNADAEATTEATAETASEELDAAAAEVAATANASEQMCAEEEQFDINDAYDTLSTLNAKLNKALSMVDSSTQTVPMSMALALYAANTAGSNSTALKAIATPTAGHCGPNRIQHANSLEPSVPCHALNSIVSALNAQISLLLPKISERDMERERLRKENQHLRELLNAMHERKRVEAKLETPTDITNPNSDDAINADEIDGGSGSSNSTSNSNSDSPPTAVLTATSTPLAATSAAIAATTPTISNADDSAATEPTSATEHPSTPTTTGTTATATIIVEADN